MTPETKDVMTTADLVRASDEVRGLHDEPIVNRSAEGALTEPVVSTPAPHGAGDALGPAREPVGSVAQMTSKDDLAQGRAAEPRASSSAVARTSDNPNVGSNVHAALFADDEAGRFRHRWSETQTGFVDEPRRAVEQADSLVADVMKRLAEVFANERTTLEHQWDRGADVTTEDLRVALQRYRSFFDRLLSI
jgi:hypothetical protein